MEAHLEQEALGDQKEEEEADQEEEVLMVVEAWEEEEEQIQVVGVQNLWVEH